MRPITILILVLFSASVFADRTAETFEQEQDPEPYAVTRTSQMPPELTSPDAACLSTQTVRTYERASRAAIIELKTLVKNPATRTMSLHNVATALKHNHLIRGGSLGPQAKDSATYLKRENFVNLLACPGWAARLKNLGRKSRLPLGSLITYAGSRYGNIKMVTDEGCAGNGGVKPGTCFPPPRQRVTGIWVKLID